MFYVTSTHLPTVAFFTDLSLAYAFRKTLLDEGLEATIIETDKEE